MCEQPIVLSKLLLDTYIGTSGKKLQNYISAISSHSSLYAHRPPETGSLLVSKVCTCTSSQSSPSHIHVTPLCSVHKKLVTCSKEKKKPCRYSEFEDAVSSPLVPFPLSIQGEIQGDTYTKNRTCMPSHNVAFEIAT